MESNHANHATEPAETSLSGKSVNSPGTLATKLKTKRTVAATAKSTFIEDHTLRENNLDNKQRWLSRMSGERTACPIIAKTLRFLE